VLVAVGVAGEDPGELRLTLGQQSGVTVLPS